MGWGMADRALGASGAHLVGFWFGGRFCHVVLGLSGLAFGILLVG